MEKRRFFALTGAEKSKIARLSIVAAAAIIVVFACIMWTIDGELWAPILGVILSAVACVCLEEADKIERKAKERESQK